MRYSIIIPTLNEDKNISSCIRSIIDSTHSINQEDDVEIVVTDGGSRDSTLEIVKGYENKVNIKILRSDKDCLPDQLNRGASAARGDILIFLHADCRIAPNTFSEIKNGFQRSPELIGGAFTMKVEGRRFFYRILSLCGDIYCRVTGIFFGDRAIFIKRENFAGLSGFKNIPIMSDYDLSKRMKGAGKVFLLKGPVISSGRKFDGESFFRIIYLTVWSLSVFNLGIDPAIIRKKYYGS